MIRIRWPDGVPQAELNIAADQLTRITELNRKGTSCPVLFVWDGQRYRYVTDFLGAQFVWRVAVTEVFPNCPRYIHKYQLVERSHFVPRTEETPPVPAWKTRE